MKIQEILLQPNNARLTCYLQDKSPEMTTADIRPAMLVFPGGGYFMCSDREAEPIALAYLAEGFNAFVLCYSTGIDTPWEKSYADGVAAIGYIRSHAEEFGIDPQKLAVAGFSAGGHMAASMGTVSADKPNAMVLGYPVIMEEMGPPVGKAIAACDKAVSDTTPPAFIFATSDDNIVPIENSLRFASALAAHDIYFEMHIYPMGEHGFSTGKAAHANGNPGTVNKDAQQWLPASIRFLQHVFGDFPIHGQNTAPDLPDHSIASLDTPLRYLVKRPECVAAIEKVLPDAMKMVNGNIMVPGMSFRQLAFHSPDYFTTQVMDSLASGLAACNQKEDAAK